MVKVGIHQSFDGLINAARDCRDYGFNTFQIFTRNNRNLRQRDMGIDEFFVFNSMLMDCGFTDVVIHAPYVMNPASGEDEKREKAIGIIKSDLVLDTLHQVASEAGTVKIAVETMAGQGTQLLSDLSQLGWFLQVISGMPHVEVCVDTCHFFAAAIQHKQLLAMFDIFNVKGKLGVIHVNDSQREFGSFVDRHASIGKGHITNLQEIVTDLHAYAPSAPIILETPEEHLVEDANIVTGWL